MKWVLPVVRGLFARLKGTPNNTNQSLIRAMEEYDLHPTDRHRTRYFQELLGSFLAVPTPEPWGLEEIAAGKKFELLVYQKNGGRKWTPAFTDMAALRIWDPNISCAAKRGQDFFQAMMEIDLDEVVINPFDPIRKRIRPMAVVTRSEIESLAAGSVPELPPWKEEIDPKFKGWEGATFHPCGRPFPSRVELRLRRTAKQRDEVLKLVLFDVRYPSGVTRPVIGIDLWHALPDEEMAAIMKQLMRCVPRAMVMEFTFLNQYLRMELSGKTEVIFERSSG